MLESEMPLKSPVAASQPRLGRVGYINCLPVFYALEQGEVVVPAMIVSDHPSRLNRLVMEGKIDVSAVSSVAYCQLQDTSLILPDLSISCDGSVWSVALLSRVPLSDLGGKRVSLTPHSGTSIILLQLLFKRYYGIETLFFTRPWGVSPWWGEAAATLVIGDEALKLIQAPERDYIVYDLGEEWKRATGRPMVFSFCVARRDFAQGHRRELERIWQGMINSREWGQRHMERIVGYASQLVGLPEAILAEYYRHLQFGLDESRLEALKLFYAQAGECGLLPKGIEIEIWRRQDGFTEVG